MALSINKIMLTARLTRDPESKYLASGTAVASFGVAYNRKYKKGDDWKEEVSFFDVEAWGKTAEIAVERLKRGGLVYIEGSLKQESWERDGVKQSKIKITADVLKPFDAPKKGDADAGDADDAPAPAQTPARSGFGRQSVSMPSEALDFGNPAIQDDIPF